MKTIHNVKKVALIFFIITGVLHLGSTVLIANNLFLKQAEIANKIMDIPFVLTGLLYGLASLRIALTNPNKSHKILDIALISFIIIAFAGLLVINILIPDIQA